jgi:alcohol dehydrogenase
MSQGIALEGMRLVLENLPKVYADPTDLEARAHMMSAAAMGATAFQKGLGAIHSLSHPVGALYDTHHGMTNAVFMPYVMAYNRKAIEPRMERLAAWLGLKKRNYKGVLKWVLELREEIGVPHTLAGLRTGAGTIDDKRIALIARMAVADPTAGSNPVELTNAGARKIFRRALEGKL